MGLLEGYALIATLVAIGFACEANSLRDTLNKIRNKELFKNEG